MAKDRAYYIKMARQYAAAKGLPVDLYLSQLKQESGFNPNARSYADARGIAQIVPRWHPDVNPRMAGNQAPGVNPLWDLDYSTSLMASHVKKYGSYERALSAYNSGRPDTYKDPKFAGGQTYNYVKNIYAMRGQFKAGAKNAPPPTTSFGGADDSQLPAVSSTDGDMKRQAMAQWLMANNAALAQGQLPTHNPRQFLMAAHVANVQKHGMDGGEAADPGVTMEAPVVKGQPWQKVIGAIKYAQGLGLRVSENPYVDKVDPVHVRGSDHYQTYKGKNVGHAFDVSGDPKKLKALFSYLERNYQGALDDMFYTPVGYSFDEGKKTSYLQPKHDDHLHASFY